MGLLMILIFLVAFGVVFGSHAALGILLVCMIAGGAFLLIAGVIRIIDRPPRGWR